MWRERGTEIGGEGEREESGRERGMERRGESEREESGRDLSAGANENYPRKSLKPYSIRIHHTA